MDPELKKKVESVLFAVGKKMELSEIAKLVGTRDLEIVKGALLELQFDYEQSDRSIHLQNDGDFWKLAVRDRYTPVISKIVTQTELTKTVMETLAVIAYKSPMMQSDLIKIRTNKAYDHLVELEKMGYITRKKKGRTKEIRLAEKFFEYFDIPPERLKDKFRTVKEMEELVESKEQEFASRKAAIEEKLAASKKTEEDTKAKTIEEIQQIDEHIEKMPAIELIDDRGNDVKLEVVEEPQTFSTDNVKRTKKSQIKIVKEEFKGMEVVPTTTKPEEGEPEMLEGMEVYERKKRQRKTKIAEEARTEETPAEELIGESKIEEAPRLFDENAPKDIQDLIERRARELMTAQPTEGENASQKTEDKEGQKKE